jgi:hypothetical protein
LSVNKIDTPSLTNDQIIWQIVIWFYTQVLCITDYFSDTLLIDVKDITFPSTLNTLDLDKYYYDLNSYAAIEDYTKNPSERPHISEGSIVTLAIFFYLHAKLGHNVVFYPSESFRKKNVFLIEEENTVYYIKYGDDATYDSIRNIVLDLSKKHKICQYKILTLDKDFKKTKMFKRFVFDLSSLKDLNKMTKHLEE